MNYSIKHFGFSSISKNIAILSFCIISLLLCQSPLYAFASEDNRFISATKEIVLKDSSGAEVSQVLYVIEKNFNEVCQHVKLWADTTMGIRGAVRRVNQDSIVEYRIMTKPYNKVESVGGYSQLQIILYDGSNIMGLDCTLMTMLRIDTWRDWVVLWRTGIHLPFTRERDSFNITETEVHFANDITASLKINAPQYFVTYNILEPLKDADLLRKIKRIVSRKD